MPRRKAAAPKRNAAAATAATATPCPPQVPKRQKRLADLPPTHAHKARPPPKGSILLPSTAAAAATASVPLVIYRCAIGPVCWSAAGEDAERAGGWTADLLYTLHDPRSGVLDRRWFARLVAEHACHAAAPVVAMHNAADGEALDPYAILPRLAAAVRGAHSLFLAHTSGSPQADGTRTVVLTVRCRTPTWEPGLGEEPNSLRCASCPATASSVLFLAALLLPKPHRHLLSPTTRCLQCQPGRGGAAGPLAAQPHHIATLSCT